MIGRNLGDERPSPKTIFDVSSFFVVAGTLIDWLPAVAALASLAWSLIRNL